MKKSILLLTAVFSLVNASNIVAKESKKPIAISPKQAVTSGFADIVEDLLPAVVNISAVQEVNSKSKLIDEDLLKELPRSPLFEEFRKKLENQLKGKRGKKKKLSSIGSGFIISKDGYIVTNSHVIKDASEITINLNNGDKFKAKVIGYDSRTDLALIKITTKKKLKFIKFGDSSKSRIGDWIIAIGNPYGLGGSVSAGIISAKSRDINNGQSEEYIQTDAAINKGNSGGPIINMQGEVIGISTAIYSPSGGSVGIGFAIPSSNASQIIQQLKEQGRIIRGWLGVSIQDVSEDIASSMGMKEAKGAFVVDVIENSPADKAGILVTDIVVGFDGKRIDKMKTLPKIVSRTKIGKKVEVSVLRRGKIKNLRVRIEKMKDDDYQTINNDKKSKKHKFTKKKSTEILGLNLAELTAKISKGKNINSKVSGLLVVSLDPDSQASQKGIAVGDIILSANQVPVTSTKTLNKIVAKAKDSKKKKLFLFIKRSSGNYGVVLDVK